MKNFIVYNESTGKILWTGTCTDDLLSAQVTETGQAVVEGIADYKSNYMAEGEVTSRPAQSITLDKTTLAADGVDKVTITGATAGATLTAKGNATGSTGSGACANPDYFSAEVADTYTLTVSCWPYLDFVTTVTAS